MEDKPPPYSEKNGFYNKAYDGSLDIAQLEGRKSEENRKLQKEKELEDPWALPDLENTETPWGELDTCGKILRVAWLITRIIMFLAFLYFFICSLTFLSDGFKLVGGKSAGEIFRKNEILSNPVAGVMIGVLATVLVQSSSTSTSIVVGMVGGQLLDVKTAIPIVMGANIGTSVTNTIVSMGQIANKDDFRRAFAGATVHDMFNWLTVIILLPIEVITGYLYILSDKIVNSINMNQDFEKQEFLKKITKPFTNLIIILDSKQITNVAKGEDVETLLKDCCVKDTVMQNVSSLVTVNETIMSTVVEVNKTEWGMEEVKVCVEKCEFAFKHSGLNDHEIGAIILVGALIMLCVCLLGIVKTMNSVLKGNIRKAIRKFINYEFPGRWSYFTGYIAILVGTGLTFLVQSSSIFTSTLTPLVGVGVVSLERMYPLTLGSNIGTTTTSILAALATDDIRLPLQVSMCHLFFNLSGILIFYPLTFMRFPIPMAKHLGMVTSKYRWFALVYLIAMFGLFPAGVFALSIAGWYVVLAVLLPIALLVIFVGVIKVIQHKKQSCLPKTLQNWKFLPVCCRSLEPIDRTICGQFTCCKSCNNKYEDEEASFDANLQNGIPTRSDNTRL
ncbi:solute carrier family 34 (sodium-dependent phosphate cotransporter) [Mytilus galloprovincialis]|uniref:Solute carrier family 34 (Sodium-dependent phosphate cotransporter) n=1 Tax=Mytilus galloprovincialis TaxID=29158 RepID=A0A8B6CZV6_MYTGA|nr:solute carrier family 34 (sodium-dependent phosphate cotransporter) [Mytilus galloprovincialis]